jgi:hypothetical protein
MSLRRYLPRSASSRPTRRPSRLGLVLTFCLLIGLLLWRTALPGASPWLDLAALTLAGVFLLAVRSFVRGRGDKSRD